MQDPSIGAYSRINELVKGFDKKIIQAAFKVYNMYIYNVKQYMYIWFHFEAKLFLERF